VGERPTYEYVKFILSLKDIHSGKQLSSSSLHAVRELYNSLLLTVPVVTVSGHTH
jgi:hypothetical protein